MSERGRFWVRVLLTVVAAVVMSAFAGGFLALVFMGLVELRHFVTG